MFTGLVTHRGTVRRIDHAADVVMEIAAPKEIARAVGDSIACNGICLTVTKTMPEGFEVQLSPETMRITTADRWKVGDAINLEAALAHGDKMGGHYVSGHVDGQVTAIAAEKSGDSVVWTFEAPESLMRFIAPKGSVTLDGVSLTVNTVEKNLFTVNVIPHTQVATGFGNLKLLDRLNIEIDMLARYAARAQETA